MALRDTGVRLFFSTLTVSFLFARETRRRILLYVQTHYHLAESLKDSS